MILLKSPLTIFFKVLKNTVLALLKTNVVLKIFMRFISVYLDDPSELKHFPQVIRVSHGRQVLRLSHKDLPHP